MTCRGTAAQRIRTRPRRQAALIVVGDSDVRVKARDAPVVHAHADADVGAGVRVGRADRGARRGGAQ